MFFGYPPYQQQPQSPIMTLKQQIEDMKSLQEFLEKQQKPSPPKSWRDTKFSLWEAAILMALTSFLFAFPILLWVIHSLAELHDTLNTLMK